MKATGLAATILAMGMFIAAPVVLTGCSDDDDLGDALEDVGDNVEDAADDAGDAIKDAVD